MGSRDRLAHRRRDRRLNDRRTRHTIMRSNIITSSASTTITVGTSRYPATKTERRWPSRQSPAGSPPNLSSDHGVAGMRYHSTTGRHGSLRCRLTFAGLGKSAHAMTKAPAHSRSNAYLGRNVVGPIATSITLLPYGARIVAWTFHEPAPICGALEEAPPNRAGFSDQTDLPANWPYCPGRRE